MPISDRSHIIQTAFMRCCCHQATDLHAMGFVASNFLLLRPPSAPRTSNIFFVSLSTSSIILYMKEKKIIISECISATDRNNEFQLRVLLLRDEMLLRSVFSVWAKIKDFLQCIKNLNFCAKAVFNFDPFFAFYSDFHPFYNNFQNIRK